MHLCAHKLRRANQFCSGEPTCTNNDDLSHSIERDHPWQATIGFTFLMPSSVLSPTHHSSTGTNYKGKLCLGHREDRTLPTVLAHVDNFLHDGHDFSYVDEGVGVASIEAGSSSIYLLLTNGMLLACGENTHGQLGIGDDGHTTGVGSSTSETNPR